MDGSLPNIPAEAGGSIVQTADPNAPPVKRRPGRPKGSGKKQHADSSAIIGDKIKRPVGRPRKDGLPAGSVSARRATQLRKSSGKASADAAQLPPGVPFPGAYYPQHPGIPNWQTGFAPLGGQTSISAPPVAIPTNGVVSGSSHQSYQIDPSLNRDEWAELSRTKPDTFLQTLLAALAAPNPLPSAGPTVEDAFKSHLSSLSPSSNQNKDAHSIPSLYSILKTFWLPSSPAYLSLIASGPNARTLSEHRYLYWDPLPLVFNGIACTTCSSPLSNRGRIRTGPIKVYDLEKPFFIIGCEYVCKSATCTASTTSEGRKFASTDASIMQALPARLKEEFPARLLQGDSDMGSGMNVWNWHAMGVSKSLWNMVKGCLRVGMPKDAILHVIGAIQNPLKDDREKHEEEEEEDGAGEDAQGISTIIQPDSGMVNSQNTSDEYSNAWKANSAAAEAGPSQPPQPQTQPSSSTMASVTPDVPTQSSTPAQPAHFTFAQPGPYVTYPYAGYPFFPQPAQNQNAPPPPPPPPTHPGADQNGLKRPFAFGENSSEVAILEPSQKRTRHCCKCGSQDCKGKGGRTFCLNACQDCGKIDCRGRNSRRPDKLCSEAWN
ncbi:hypothetical protein HYDPIDRAFT_157013 [Hydnomerulius pinastri MD-312]|uniref:Unplaced genomic scaffold scaffold_19, whole genome shotgun sequence n=1 Tax=Hydnomerulius pinastri MD-312 TaxID=994086 RepID=A0A0C9W715_9AGAM|nr:hypothetical protein HYDPIDRAFT_157013 [Hydnomerulius pinastri MD-312]